MTDETQRYNRYAEKKAGTQNKFYEVECVREEGATHVDIVFRWGRIGTTGQEKRSTSLTWRLAKNACIDQFNKKLAKGYREVTAMEALASAVETVEERKTNGHEAVELDVPRFHAGTSEKRCQQMCEKALRKLNLVRKSRWDLGDKYEKQIEGVLKSYCKEWNRILQTKAHGHLNHNSHAATAFRIFFGSLKDNAKCYVYGYFPGVGNSY